MTAASAAIPETYRLDLQVVHPANVDAARHETGLFTEPVTESLQVVAEITQTLIDAVKRMPKADLSAIRHFASPAGCVPVSI